jgi:hypothetical protein
MHLHTSWKALFALITMVNKAGNRNVAGFTGAMELKASLGNKMTKLVQPFGLLLAANEKQGITILHHPYNFGGTLLRPSSKVGCLVGVGSSAVPVMLAHDGALRPISANVPPIVAIANCATVNDLATLPTAPAAAGNAAPAGRRSNAVKGAAAGKSNAATAGGGQCGNGAIGSVRARGTGAAGGIRVALAGQRGAPSNDDDDSVAIGEGNVDPADSGIAAVGNGGANLKALLCFIPAPFLRNAVLAANSSLPLELVIAARLARDAHVQAHEGEEEFDEGNVDAHIKLFSLWCLGVHQRKVEETRFLLAPDDGKLADWSACFYRSKRAARAKRRPRPGGTYL